MKDIYEGRALWLGMDEPMDGLLHGKAYLLQVKQMRNGKIRVDLDSEAHGLRAKHMTFKSKEDFYKHFFLKRDGKEKRR